MSCTHLQKTLKLKALEQFGTQTPTIDGRRVINALDQVAANLVVLLVVKNNIFAAMNELSDLMDKGLHLKKPRTTTTATSAYSSSRSKDFVASSIEFPTAPPLTVAHVLEILPIAQPVILDGAENVADAFQSFAIDLLDELIQQEESLPHDQGGSSSTSSTSGAEQEFRRIMSPPTTPRRNLAAPVLNLSFQDGDSDSEDETPEPTEETFEITPITPKTFFGIPSPPRSSITGESTYHERRGSSLLLEEDSLASDTFSLPSSPSKPNTNPDTNTLQDQFSCLTLVEDSPPRATQLRTMSTPKFGSKRKSGPSVPVIDSSSPFFVAETPLAVAPAAEQRNDFDQYKSLPSTPTIRKGSANCKFSDSLIAFPRNETLPLDSERQTPTFPIKRPTPHHDTVDDVHLIDSLSRLNVCCPSSLSETFPSPKKRTRHSKDDDDGDWRCESQTQYSSTGTSKISFKDGDIDDWLCSQSFSRGLNRGSTGSGNLGGASQGFSELNG
ncbi:hypothetical protein BDR26DRAFT_862010 [Obelidium mucronatum]|nr:hypothetical protein BDR26DRAFT_862010 [Obelidium mucronatum]